MMKQPLSNEQTLLIINGPSCAGKSSVANLILQRYGRIFHAKSDTIKRLISGYDAPIDRGAVHAMALAMIPMALNHGLSVLKEGALWHPEELQALGEQHQVRVIIANISAPKAVLDARFLERIAIRKPGSPTANDSQVRFDELYQMYQDGKPETALEFDSSVESPEEIAERIIAYIQQ